MQRTFILYWLGLIKTAGVTVDLGKVTMECMSMAKDGIHAVLVVFSAMSRFSEEDAAVIDSIRMMFGERIVLVFTHGDDVEKEEFRDMLSAAPEYMLVCFKFSTSCVSSCLCLILHIWKTHLVQYFYMHVITVHRRWSGCAEVEWCSLTIGPRIRRF